MLEVCFSARNAIVFALALMVGTTGACAARPHTAEHKVEPAFGPWVRVPLGLCEDYPEESRSLAEVRADLTLIASLGVDVLRVSLGWDGIEPQRDRYELAFWDAFVAEATNAHIRLIPYVAYTPRWIARDTGPEYWKSPPRDVAEFAQIMALLAARYRGRVASWEIWNEPDNRDFWAGSAADYAALLGAGARAVHAAAPEADIVLGGIAGHPEFAAEVLGLSDAADLVSVVNAHAYFETWNPEPLESLPAYVAAFAPALAGRRRLWLAEVGYADYRRGDHVSAHVRARFGFEHTPAFQAVTLVTTLALALAQPQVTLFAWYEIKDPAAGAPMIGDDNNRHLGVLFADRRPKPAAAALRSTVALLGRGFVRLDDRLVVSRPAGSRAQVHAFLNADRHAVVVAWLPTAAADRGSPAQSIAIELPLAPIGPARRLDALGIERERRASVVSSADPRRLRLDRVELHAGDVTVWDVPVAGHGSK